MNNARGRPWQNRFGTKNTSFIEAMLYHNADYKQLDIARVTPSAVVLSDGSAVECDAIVACTGFSIAYPYLDTELANTARNARAMFKHMILPKWGCKIAFLGLLTRHAISESSSSASSTA